MAAINGKNAVINEAGGISTPGWQLWTGRVRTTLAVLFLLFDAAGKLMMPSFVVDAFNRLGFPVGRGVTLGVILTASTILYAIPRTAVLGAVLLTGYLGGAVAIHTRAESSLFETVFPVIFGLLTWVGIYLRDFRLRALLPVRR
jgi:hypothetical protein